MSSAATRPSKEPVVAKATILEMLSFATEVFENEAVADRWLHEPNLATNNRPPVELLINDEGRQKVKSLLTRIEYGVLA